MQASTHKIETISGRTVLQRSFYCVAALAVLSLCLAATGRFLGHMVSLGGHTEETALQEVVIGNNVLEIPANMIRFDRQRRSGVAERVDLYVHWPDMQGYRPDVMQDFNGSGLDKKLLFLTFEPSSVSQDMSGRYGQVYSTLTDGPGTSGPGGLTIQRFRADSGFVNEELLVSPERGANALFVARCLDEQSSKSNLASCQRDIFVGDDLQLTYRFPREMLRDWELLDRRVADFAKGRIKGAE